MGDRVAVMRKGELQQVAPPQELYERPVNLFVGGFIGSPAMNLVEATIQRRNGELAVHIGEHDLTLSDELLAYRPALQEYVGRHVVVGIRPENLEDAALEPDTPDDQRMRGVVVLREPLGSEIVAHFTVDAPPALTEDVRELARDVGQESAVRAAAAEGDDETVMVGRFGPRSRIKNGDVVDVAVETGALHFFDLETGLGIYSQAGQATAKRQSNDGEGAHGMRYRWLVFALLVGALAFVAAGCGGETTTGEPKGSEDVSGEISIMATWGGAEQEAFEAVIDGFNELYPNVTVNYTSAGNNLVYAALHGRGRWKPAGSRGRRPARPDGGLRRVGRASSRWTTSARRSSRASASPSRTSEPSTGRSTGSCSRAPTSRPSGTTSRPSRRPASSRRRPGRTSQRHATRSMRQASRRTRWASTQGGRSPTSSRTSTSAARGRRCTTSCRRHEIPWTDQSVKDALTLMADVVGESDYMAGGTEGALQTAFDQSATNVFRDPPEGAMLHLGDFAPGVADTTLEPETGYNVFDFPAIEGSAPAVMGGGDLFIKFADNPATNAFLEYLTTADAAAIWAELGGFSSPNKDLDVGVYPDEITRTTAGALAEAEVFRFDMSDLQPAEFGGTRGTGALEAPDRLRREPGQHRRDHGGDGGRRGEGVRVGGSANGSTRE